MMNAVLSLLDVTSTRPPWASIIERAMARPRPAPSPCLDLEGFAR